MADFTQGSVLESPVFEFIVGPAKKSFKVHSALVAKVSEPLQVMMSSQMLEGIWKSVTMDDIYEDTFIRFCQYLYYGTYLVPESAPSRKGAGPPPATKVGVQTGFISNPTSQLASAASRKLPTYFQAPTEHGLLNAALFQTLNAKVYTMARSDTYSLGPSSLEPQWFSERVGFSAGILFSAHARLYVFADRYQVDDLKRMVLQRLNEDIVDYPLHVLGTSYVTTLIDYVYDDENTADKDWPSIDQLRDLVSHYAACWIQVLKKEDDFNQLMEDRR